MGFGSRIITESTTSRYVFKVIYDVQALIEILSQKLEQRRFRVLRETLRHLNLESAPEVIPQRSLSPLFQYLINAPTSRYQRPQNPFSHLQASVVSGEHQDVEFLQLSSVTTPDWAGGAAHRETTTRQRCIWVICPAELPRRWSRTPHFNLTGYFELLGIARGRQRSNSFLGNNVLYGEAVKSTQSQLTL